MQPLLRLLFSLIFWVGKTLLNSPGGEDFDKNKVLTIIQRFVLLIFSFFLPYFFELLHRQQKFFQKHLGKKSGMRNIFLAMIVICISCYSCTKENSIKAIQFSIIGTWELTRSYSGWTGDTTYPAGNGNTITFRSNGSYTGVVVRPDTSFTVTGNYQIYNDKPCESAPDTTLISFSDGDYPNIISIKNEELNISDPSYCIADGGGNSYKRLR